MMWRRLPGLNLGSKIAFAVGGVLVLSTTILTIVALYYVGKLGTYLESSQEDTVLPYQQAAEINDALDRTTVALLSAMGAKPSERPAQRSRIDSQRQIIARGSATFARDLDPANHPLMLARLKAYGVVDDEVRREDVALNRLLSTMPRLDAAVDTVWRLIERGQNGAAHAIYERVAAPLFDRVVAASSELMAIQLDESVYASRAGRVDLQRTQRSIALTVGVALMLALITAIGLTRNLTRPLKALVQGTRAVARGDLPQPVLVTTRDEIGVLATAFNDMVAALRDERHRAQRYLDTAEVILLGLDTSGRITLANRYACSVLGWTEEELRGRDFIETCVPARLRDETRERLGQVLAGSDSSIVDNAIVTKSGDERMVEWRNTLQRDDQGHVVSTFSSGTDITDRNRAIEALRTAEERTRFALEAAGVGIWDTDYTTGVYQWSDTLEAQYGLQPGTFGGTLDAFVAGVHPDDRQSLFETVGKAMKSGADFSTLNRSVGPDGVVRWLSGAGRIHLGANGEPVRGIGISRDVTNGRNLEAQYQQAQKMEAVGRLAGGVAHDFNNLLTVILGFCELLLTDIEPTDQRRPDVEEIQKAGMSASLLTRQLLAFSRKEIIEPTVLDLNEVVTHLRAMLERLIGDDVTVLLGLRPDLARVKADRGQLEQIVLNLAVNARDAMLHGGTLTIETANVELDEHYEARHPAVVPGQYVMLTVSDTGTGMTPEVQARLFEPFFTTKDIGKGTGLGLATVHGIVAQNAGSVDVYSEVGIGTSFKVYFPRVGATEMVVDVPAPVSRRPSGTETVLVVDDAEGLRELTKRLLEQQGYTVVVAANADEALLEFQRNPSIDLILTDVVMPGVSGPKLAQDLLDRRPTLKVVYMSGYTDEAIVHHGILNPGIAFLHKPFTSETLGRKIREVLDR